MNENLPLGRRRALQVAGAAAALLPLGAMAPARPLQSDASPLAHLSICHVADTRTDPVAKPGTKLKLTWNANAICTVGVPVAAKRGIFAKHGLNVELMNFGGSTDQLLEAISTGKADAGVGMALRWLKPLEQGLRAR